MTGLDERRRRVLALLEATAPEPAWRERAEALELVVLELVALVHDAAERDARGVVHLDGAELLATLEWRLARDVALRLSDDE